MLLRLEIAQRFGLGFRVYGGGKHEDFLEVFGFALFVLEEQ